MPLQAVLDSMATLLADSRPCAKGRNQTHQMLTCRPKRLRIVDNSTIPDLCLQHLVALMIVDRGRRASQGVQRRCTHERPEGACGSQGLVELIGSEGLQKGPYRHVRAIVQIETTDGALRSAIIPAWFAARQPIRWTRIEIEAKALDLMAPVLGWPAEPGTLIAVVNAP